MAYISFQPSDYFNTLLYTGNDTDNRAITGVGFQPDWTWIKLRNTTQQHELFDAVRGANKPISSNATDAETTATNKLKSFDSDGFTLGTSTSVNKIYNYASWNWKANGQGSSNTDGSINTTYTSVSTTSGFSINLFTATGSAGTIGHGLNAVPKMILVKDTNGTGSWQVYHASLGATKYLALNENIAAGTASNRWNDTTPTSSVFSIGSEWSSGKTLIAYAFAEKKGFSKFGSYTGNGNADGSFIYTGFKPAFVIIKLYSTGAENWRMFDNKRIGYNPNNYKLYPSLTSAEGTSDLIDLYSNGFKPRSTSVEFNGSGNGYIYMAFAEHPLVSSNGVPAVAR